MARSIGMAKDATVFRAVITKQRADGPVTDYEGPYGSIAAARARVSFWVNYMAEYDDDTGEKTGKSRASGHVERGTVSWTRA